MSVLVNELTLGDLLKYEEESLYSRDQVTVAAGQNLRIGTVLGRVDANGKVKALDPAATDGTQIATAVLLQSVDATAGEKYSGIAVTRQSIVAHHALVWPAAITAEEKATATAQLEAVGILVRQGA
ncbi:head decoration protein [Limnohabitans sp.]|uniref:head decoration protein n=1 Tax=Limnohabitans sp. TaxID=1907725 RepID=UPI00286FA72E|nr:head decoration protein [Limnohabitans sp.]